MKKRTVALLSVLVLLLTLTVPASGLHMRARDRIAGRSGPGTDYSEPGSFYQAGYFYNIVSRSGNWVQLDFSYKGKQIRVYTGKKRFSITPTQWAKIPKEQKLYSGVISQAVTVRSGPGSKYEKLHRGSLYSKGDVRLKKGTKVTVYAKKNGYLQIDFKYNGLRYRGWVLSKSVSQK